MVGVLTSPTVLGEGDPYASGLGGDLAFLDPAAGTTGASQAQAPGYVDPTTCHLNCENLFANDSAAFADCVAKCSVVPSPDCSQFGFGACTPNWIPLPGSGATAPIPLSLKLGVPAVVLLIGAAVLAAIILRVNVSA